MISQGEIWWADLPRPRGSEPAYRRPLLVVQSNAFNRSRIRTVICVVLTSNLRLSRAPGNVLLHAEQTGLPKDSVANVSQIITLNKEELTDCVGQVSKVQLTQVLRGIHLILAQN